MNKYAVKRYSFYALYRLFTQGIKLPLLFYSLDFCENFSNLISCPYLKKRKELLQISESVFAAIIAMIGTCIGSFGGIITSSKLTSFRIEKLEEKVDKHNNFAERMPVIEERIKAIDHRIDSLEGKME